MDSQIKKGGSTYLVQKNYHRMNSGTYKSLKSAPKTSAVKRFTSVAGSFHASGARPALCEQQYERNSSLLQPVSVATCGRKQPDVRPFLIYMPSTPSRRLNGSSVFCNGERTDISISSCCNSLAVIGSDIKRGSPVADAFAISVTNSINGESEMNWPIQPRNCP